MTWLKRIIFILLLLCMLVYAVLFSLRNHSQVDIDLVFILLPDVQVEFALVFSFIFGALFGLLAPIWAWLARFFTVSSRTDSKSANSKGE